MSRYAAFLRGVMPTNAKMPELKRAFEAVGFTDVRTVLASGNVVFTASPASAATLERKAEAAMEKHLGRSFLTIVRPVAALRDLLESDPYAPYRLAFRATCAARGARNWASLALAPSALRVELESRP